jgi:hypothetical protein
MSKWAVITAFDGNVHVVPCNEQTGGPLHPHVLTESCICEPRRDAEEPELLIHFDPERGGYDA